MYACVHETSGGFFEGVCGQENRPLLSVTDPYHPGSRERFCASTRYPMMLAAVNLYSLLQYLVLATSRKAEQLAILCPHLGEAMQDIDYDLLSIFLSRTRVNKPSSGMRWAPGDAIMGVGKGVRARRGKRGREGGTYG
jgi:hypothetical protein